MTAHISTWQQELASAFSKPEDLLLYLDIDSQAFSHLSRHDFAMRVPLSYANCMQKGKLDDPLLMQVLPIADELSNPAEFQNDPVGDLSALTENCIIHKYQGRVLFITTGGCAINCRFCFRRNFPYAEVQLNKHKEATALGYIQDNPDIHEVILSGGDPLLLSDQRLNDLMQKLSRIAHLKRIRIHTRLPIVLPARITSELISILKNSPIPIIIVTHCNHANELSVQVITACRALKQPNITLLNQSVLLKGINDNTQILQSLSEQLFAAGILPYYLHLLDKAKGTAHFEITQTKALKIHQALQHVLPGYLVPKLVKEQAGEAAKTLIV
ncbi:EF-P beta-lysylation protein EpmB [Methyloprofundus sedimenti]|uniref:L-lysine 2,3-aminomutase n=1 Tax=Methyloprofundus sedimenti TaxID=1420851 RepID=A0A1V8M8H5_9GAMM|nr:EF-P beta-lysylation protein EpmB [Methyloprofundus sedimenti]OQK17884.1 EF-P beta-lysylation protein EpmB [Methyloprofundus sedimenti]